MSSTTDTTIDGDTAALSSSRVAAFIHTGYTRLRARTRWDLIACGGVIAVLTATAGFPGAIIGIAIGVTRLFFPAPYTFALGHAGAIAVVPPTIGVRQMVLIEAAFLGVLGAAALGQPRGRAIAGGTLGGGLILLWPLTTAATQYPMWVVALCSLGAFTILLYGLFRYDIIAISTNSYLQARATQHKLRDWLNTVRGEDT